MARKTPEMNTRSPRVLVVAPFTHQNGHFVTLPRDLACALAITGATVTLLHPRPFRTELDWMGASVSRICLRDQLDKAPRWWQELWARLANSPVNQCLAWMIWKLRPKDYDLVLWTDFQEQSNIWPLQLARILGLYRYRTAFIEHFAPDQLTGWASACVKLNRLWVTGLPMLVFSRTLHDQWRAWLGGQANVKYVPHGLWPSPLHESRRAQVREAMNIAPQARVLLVFGVQAVKRKHLDTLLHVLQGFVPENPLILIFAGKTLGNEPHPFTGWQGRNVGVRIDNRFISEAEVESYFLIADAVWANYRDFPGASGVLFHAMAFGRLLISSSEGEIGTLTREYQLGFLLESSRAEDLRNTLNDFINMSPLEQREREAEIAASAQRFSWCATAQQIMAGLGFVPTLSSASATSI